MGISKAERERIIFRLFASSIGINLENSKVESRDPPEPDILLTYPDGRFAAFEMVEILDQDYSRTLQRQLDSKDACYEYLENLPPDHKNQFRKKFFNADIFISFKENLTFNRRKSVLPQIFDALLSLPNDVSGDVLEDDLKLNRIIDYVTVYRGGFNGPMFDSSSYVSVGDPTVEAIASKHSKIYATEHDINLLAYIETNPMYPEEVWRANLQKHYDDLTESCQFSSIYVFDCQFKQVKSEWRRPAKNEEIILY